MKNIKIVKDKRDDCIFSVESYSFVEFDSDVPQLPIYHLSYKTDALTPIDVRLMLEDISDSIEFLIEAPVELTEYIKIYEESKPFSEICLFHDLRTKHLDILLCKGENEKNNVILVGFTIVGDSVHLAIKTFSLAGLADFTEKIMEYCESKNIPLEYKNNIRWIQLEQCLLSSGNNTRNEVIVVNRVDLPIRI